MALRIFDDKANPLAESDVARALALAYPMHVV